MYENWKGLIRILKKSKLSGQIKYVEERYLYIISSGRAE
jgi:hypothetical protein